MDAIAIGDVEHHKLFNPSPEVDSIAEHLAVAVQRGCKANGKRALELIVEVIELNRKQRSRSLDFAGFADELARQIKDSEFNGDGEGKALPARALANAVRPHLRVIADADSIDADVCAAFRAIHAHTAGVAKSQVLAPRVRKELGKGPFGLLSQIVGEGASSSKEAA